MKTFKIKFFGKDNVLESIQTYHNVIDQSALLQWIINRIDCLELSNRVEASANDIDYTDAVNELMIIERNF